MCRTTAPTALCVCRHIHSMHNQDADCMLCRCGRFQISARTSSSHYRRGQASTRRRVARLATGDRILVVHDPDGHLIPAPYKTGALIATVTDDPRRHDGGWSITTTLGVLSPLVGSCAVHVLTQAPPW